MILGEKSSTRNHQRDFRSFMITKSTYLTKSWHVQPLFPLFDFSGKCRDSFPRGQTKKVSVHDLYPMNFENASGAAEHKNSSSKACLVSVSCVSLQLSLSLILCTAPPSHVYVVNSKNEALRAHPKMILPILLPSWLNLYGKLS